MSIIGYFVASRPVIAGHLAFQVDITTSSRLVLPILGVRVQGLEAQQLRGMGLNCDSNA